MPFRYDRRQGHNELSVDREPATTGTNRFHSQYQRLPLMQTDQNHAGGWGSSCCPVSKIFNLDSSESIVSSL